MFELFLKRLIVGGYDAVYEFSKDFRNEGMDKNHNPEFTMLELYVAYKDYFWMMELTESLLEKVSIELNGNSSINFDSKKISFKKPFKRISIYDAIKKYTGYDISSMDENELRDICKKMDIEISDQMGEGKLIDAIFGNKCEKEIVDPTFITDYPKSMSPLTKEHRDNPNLTERFELIINGMEIANAYSELNDPIDQLSRFEKQLELSKRGDEEAMFIDKDFIPVIAPMGVDEKKQTYNINADTTAGALATSLKSRRLMLMTDVEGVYDKNKKLISEIKSNEAEKLIYDQTIHGGMIPKISCCVDALGGGVKGAHIIDGRLPHAILLEMLTDSGVGTLFFH